MSETPKPDRETLLTLCEDYMDRYGLTEAEVLGEPTAAPSSACGQADALALAVREYLPETDRSNFFVHFGKAKDRLEELHEAVTAFYANKAGVDHAPGSSSTK